MFSSSATVWCASRGSVQQLHDQLGGLRAEVTDLRHSHELTTSEVARALDDLRALDARHTELHAGLQEHTADAARLRARLDAAEKEWREAKTPAASEPSAAATPATSAPGLVLPAPALVPPSQRPGRPDPNEPARIYEAAVANFRAREHGQAVLDFLTNRVLGGAKPEMIGDAKVSDAIVRAMILPAARDVASEFAGIGERYQRMT